MKVRLFGFMIGMALIYSGCSNPTTVKNENMADSSAKVSAIEGPKMIIAKLTVKPEKAKDFIAVAKGMIEKSNKESGCVFYQLYQDPFDSSKMVFVEEYKNQAAIDEHFSTAYFKAFGSEIADFVDGPADVKIVTIDKNE